MAKFQGGTWWDSNLRMDVCPILRSPPYPLHHRLPKGVVLHRFCSPALVLVC
ncbi:hypothetical protein E2C01_080673 [Portunus trituberculatus]|uniref:Uncharacterized protein n=1 Tax=Portunus trituberculatus TaxID=210409 RepID=A0A5B7J078_PORTR|nr:hypothetical protein [Portunus trituberculatus]